LNLEHTHSDDTAWAHLPKGLLASGQATRIPSPPPSRLSQPLSAGQAGSDRLRSPDYDQQPDRTYRFFTCRMGRTSSTRALPTFPAHVGGTRARRRSHPCGEVEPLVIVGIYNTGDAGWRVHPRARSADGRRRGCPIRPYADARNSALDRHPIPRPHRSRLTGLGGSSLGGLVSLYLGLRYATWFGKLAILSPSVWWNRKSILGYVNEHAQPSGTGRECGWMSATRKAGALCTTSRCSTAAEANHWRPGETLHFEKAHGGTHDESSWSRRVRPMLKFLFPAE